MRCTRRALPSLAIGWASLLLLLGSPLFVGALTAHPSLWPSQEDANASSDDTDQEDAPKIPEIKDEPLTIDPATLLPEKLAARGTADFSDSSLREVIEWLEQEHGLVILLETSAIEEAGITASEPVSDQLNDEPVYLLLNRLEALGLGWYFEDDIVYITTSARVAGHLKSETYNVGDLLDDGYRIGELEDLITEVIASEDWAVFGGMGALYSIGDVMFISHTQEVQYQVQGLLKALRGFGRRTMTFDPPQHESIRQALQQSVTVDFTNTPLEEAIEELSEKSGVPIRLDIRTLRDLRIREREPVMLAVRERPLETILDALLSNLDLTWVLQNGQISVTGKAKAQRLIKTAVFDVRDLCRDEGESVALIQAVESQFPVYWSSGGGPYSLQSAKPGVLVVSARERVLGEVLTLLEAYRTAFRASKVRDRDKVDPNEVVTVYYKLHTEVAKELKAALPTLVKPETWKSSNQADAIGTILMLSSVPELRSGKSPDGSNFQVFAPQSVLIVTQTRSNHEAIQKVLERVKFGDQLESFGKGLGGMGGMGGMGGSFGGGYFRIPESSSAHRPSSR